MYGLLCIVLDSFNSFSDATCFLFPLACAGQSYIALPFSVLFRGLQFVPLLGSLLQVSLVIFPGYCSK